VDPVQENDTMDEVIASVDIGATKISAAISNIDGIIIRYQEPVYLEGEEDTIALQVKDLLDLCLEKAGSSKNNLIGVGISSAGPFRRIDGMIELVSPNICGGMAPERGVIPNDWNSVPLESELRKFFQNLEIENDAVAGVVAERKFCSGNENMIYVTWSTGIGTGAYVDDRLIRGKNGNAPHGGHIYLSLEGPTCGCGNIGDLEGWASGTSIANQYGDEISTSEVFKRYHEGDERAMEIIDRAATYFAKGLASLNAVLDTSLIAIGGSVFLNNQDLLLPIVKKVFHQSFPLLSKEVEIRATGLGKHLGDVAAISLVIPGKWIEKWKLERPWESNR
jgi:glucokinase